MHLILLVVSRSGAEKLPAYNQLTMKRFLSLFFICFALAFTGCKEDTKTDIQVVTPEEMQELSELEDVQLVDVRTPQEFDDGYIANAQNIDYNSPSFDAEIEKLDKSKPVIVYCEKGSRSAKCAKKMKDAGFVKIYDLEGGLAKWKYKGFDIKSLP